MYRHSLLWHCLWLAAPALQVVVAWIVFRRRLVRVFPLFFTYTVVHVVFSSTMFLLDHMQSITGEGYWQIYSVGDVLNTALRFAVVYEIFRQLMRSYPTLTQVGRSLSKWAFALFVVAALLIARYGTAVGNDSELLASLKMLDRAIAFVQCGLIVMLFSFTYYFGLSWKSNTFGIGFGLGVISAVELAVTAVALRAGYTDQAPLFDFVSMGACLLGIGVWVLYLATPESVAAPAAAIPSNNLESWDQELRRLLQR
jgi:hypothetical protein